MTTKSQTDNTEWLDELLLEVQKNTDTWWNETREEFKGQNPAQIRETAKQAIQAKLKEQDIKSRIDELETFEWNDAHLHVNTRLAKLRSKL